MLEIDKDAEFGKRMAVLAEKKKKDSFAAIARELYDCKECWQYIHPRNRDVKYKVNEDKDLKAITKKVERDFQAKTVFEVSSQRLMAYSIIFECSMDYFFGLIEEPVPNADVKAICDKSGLSQEAVSNLLKQEKIDLSDDLAVLGGHFPDTLEIFEGLDPEGDPIFKNKDLNANLNVLWDRILSSPLFKEVPAFWYKLICSMYGRIRLKPASDWAIENWNTVQDKDLLADMIELEDKYAKFGTAVPGDLPVRKALDKCPKWAAEQNRKFFSDEYSAVEDYKRAEEIYWGISGRLERKLFSALEKMAKDEILRDMEQSGCVSEFIDEIREELQK